MRTVFLSIALILFLLAAFRVPLPIESVALGLAFLAASMLPLERTP